ncbi:MAG TPA: FAD-linked oxidase C-terminal domain-containing protein [Gemmataceae bacterium]|nr:FAD-linked oxidase C-terminal domain-containing protein [Gemmataceae bacterium]
MAVDLPQRERIRDDLKGILKGELLFDDLTCALYSTDASIFEVQPAGVVVPRDEADVQALVRYAGEHQVPLVPRGAGTGLAGESLGSGLIVDLSKHFRGILDVGADTVRVQPGVVYRDLDRELARIGRRFAPDPANVECTLGGMLATNASGVRAFRHGFTRDHVLRLRAVLADGEAVEVGRHSRTARRDAGSTDRRDELVSSVVALLEQHADTIATCRPRTRFNRCGYLLHDVHDGESLDLARLLVGSEGTLALFTEATLRTIPLPRERAVVLLGFARLDAALRAAQLTAATGPAACDLIDHRLLRLVRGSDNTLAELISAAVESVLLVEYESDAPAEAPRLAHELANRLHRAERLALLAHVADDKASRERLWQVRTAVLPSLYSLRGTAEPLAFVEDVGVPPELLPGYLYRVQEVLQRHEITASYLIHAATGQVHMRPFVEWRGPEDADRLRALADEVYEIVLDLGGTISAQHGTGLARTPWVSRQAGPLLAVFRELKSLFDPHNILNPGKIIEAQPGTPFGPLRRRAAENADHLLSPSPSPPVEEATNGADSSDSSVPSPPEEGEDAVSILLHWPPGGMVAECHSCNGCGECRTEASAQRMCPIFRATHDESATPRAKANLMRHLLAPGGDPRLLSSDEVRAVADLCVNCKMCAHECPAQVNVPKLMLQVKAANVAEHGLDRTDWAMARTESFAGLGSAFAPLANAVLENPLARWLLEKLFGLSRRRRLPAFAKRSFLRRAHRRGWTRKPRSARPRVAYFVDIFANYNDPLIAEAVVVVLHHNDIEVYVPPRQGGCGMAPLAHGDLETARETVQENLLVLSDLAREGYPILCSEPTAALMLRQDALDLLDDADARLVAAQTVESTAFLWDLHQQGNLRTDFLPLPFAVGHHVPCHLKALGRPPVGPALLSLIPEMRVHTIDVSCSGMAGTYGLKAANYETSLAAGRPMLQELASPRVLFGSTECSTCRIQMEDAGGVRTLHPVQYLALGYGYLPELRQRLLQPLRPRRPR